MRNLLLGALALAVIGLTGCQPDSLPTDASPTQIETRSAAFPDIIPLPDGIGPEGIVSGRGTDFYVGSLVDGSIYRGDYRSGDVETLFTPQEPRLAVGLGFDRRSGYLFVAGGFAGTAYVIDTRTGEELAAYALGQGFVNDVIVTRDAAYFTNSFAPEFYKLPLGPAGRLTGGRAGQPETIPLSGDFEFISGDFNSNGVETSWPPYQDTLILFVNSATGKLYEVSTLSGVASEIDLGGASLPSGDGLLRRGRDLYVVQNFFNQIAKVRLSPDGSSGEIVEVITSEDFRIPTTAAGFGSSVYAVNARFDVAPPGNVPPDTEFEVVRVDK